MSMKQHTYASTSAAGAALGERGVIVSVGDFSGKWSQPWRDAGYHTTRVDPKLSPHDALGGNDEAWAGTAQEFARYIAHSTKRLVVQGCLFAPPCTDFSSSGAQYWPAKDADGRTDAALEIVDACMSIVSICKPTWWYLENPVGRLRRLRPELGQPMWVQPHEYAHLSDAPESERYTKKTGLWGCFDRDMLDGLRGDLTPVKVCAQGSWLQKLGGKSERTKTLRSMTPQGLARATFKATQGWYK